MLASFGPGFDNAEIQRTRQTRRHAGRLQADFEPVHAHITFRHLAFDRIELRRVVRADPGAIAAAEADVGVLQHRAVFGELGVGARRATLEAHRVVAMIARHRNIHARAGRIGAPFDITHRTERDMRRQVIFFRTRGLAGVAGDAVVSVEVKAVLLVAIGVVADAELSVDAQAFTRERVVRRHQCDRLAVAVGRRMRGVGQKSIRLLFGAGLK